MPNFSEINPVSPVRPAQRPESSVERKDKISGQKEKKKEKKKSPGKKNDPDGSYIDEYA